MSDEIKKQQVVQFLRNNIQNNNIQPNRQSAIELIDKISNNLDTLGAKEFLFCSFFCVFIYKDIVDFFNIIFIFYKKLI